jgi:hypothetical protein
MYTSHLPASAAVPFIAILKKFSLLKYYILNTLTGRGRK